MAQPEFAILLFISDFVKIFKKFSKLEALPLFYLETPKGKAMAKNSYPEKVKPVKKTVNSAQIGQQPSQVDRPPYFL
jgi:hypothetical protein